MNAEVPGSSISLKTAASRTSPSALILHLVFYIPSTFSICSSSLLIHQTMRSKLHFNREYADLMAIIEAFGRSEKKVQCDG